MNYKTDKINQLLRQRKQERQKIGKYRDKRIKQKYNRIKQQELNKESQVKDGNHDGQPRSQQDARKIQFYNQVFGSTSKNNITNAANTSMHEVQQDYRHFDSQADQQNQEVQEEGDNQYIQTQVKASGGIEQTRQHQSRIANTNKDDTRHNFQKGTYNRNEKSEGNYRSNRGNKGSKGDTRSMNKREGGSKQQVQMEQMQNKADKLKQRKKKFIKKMHEKTNKGQPVMSNYVKYALTKLQQSMVKEKIASASITSNKNRSSSDSKSGYKHGNSGIYTNNQQYQNGNNRFNRFDQKREGRKYGGNSSTSKFNRHTHNS